MTNSNQPPTIRDLRVRWIMAKMEADPAFDHLRREGAQLIPGHGRSDARVVIVGATPSHQDALVGRPFSGPMHRFLDVFLAKADLKRADVWTTLVAKYRPSVEKPPTFEEVKQSKAWLRAEIDALDPQVVVLLGVLPLSTFFPSARMSVVQGRAILAGNRKYVAMPNPRVVVGDLDSRRRFDTGAVTIRHLSDQPRFLAQV